MDAPGRVSIFNAKTIEDASTAFILLLGDMISHGYRLQKHCIVKEIPKCKAGDAKKKN